MYLTYPPSSSMCAVLALHGRGHLGHCQVRKTGSLTVLWCDIHNITAWVTKQIPYIHISVYFMHDTSRNTQEAVRNTSDKVIQLDDRFCEADDLQSSANSSLQMFHFIHNRIDKQTVLKHSPPIMIARVAKLRWPIGSVRGSKGSVKAFCIIILAERANPQLSI